MGRSKLRYGRGKEKVKKWKKNIMSRKGRYKDGGIDEDVRVLVDRCVDQVESKMKLCASYEKLLDSELKELSWSIENCQKTK